VFVTTTTWSDCALRALEGTVEPLLTSRSARLKTSGPRAATPARQIRALRAGGESITRLGGRFGVSRATIYRVLREAEPEAVPA